MFQFLAITWFVTVGWVPLQDEIIGTKEASLKIGRVATVAELGFSADIFDRVNFSTSMESYQYINTDGGYFNPYRIDYKAALTFHLTRHVSLALAHECDHPVISTQEDRYKGLYTSSETIVAITWRSK